MTSKICHILFLQDRPGRHVLGGAEAHVIDMLPRLHATGCAIELLIIAWSPGSRIEKIANQLQQEGLTVTVIHRSDWSTYIGKLGASLSCLQQVRAFLQQRAQHAIHFHLDHWFLPPLLLSLAPPQVYFTFHNDEPIYGRWWFKVWFHTTMLRRYKMAAISEHVRRYCSNFLQLNPTDVALLPYGISALASADLRLGTRKAFGLPETTPIVAFVGRFVPQKNLFRFCAAFKELPTLHAALIGGGPLEAELREYVKAEGISNVSFIGPIDDARRYFHLFNLICLPSIHEGLGLVLLEAMAEVVPVCGARAGAIPDILRNGELGALFSPNSAGEIAAGISEALKHPDLLRTRAAHARRILDRDFSIESAVSHYVKLYALYQPGSNRVVTANS
ncbi:MAG: glycosyltransferase family 4 protein [Oligoflexia bacterium]|nr:glycosyltransferase family 4 protein [Oligoflexia bacterium]